MQNQDYLDLLKIDRKKHRVIAVTGGGGKTSLIYRLSDELKRRGEKVIITTTTHMAYEPSKPFARRGEEKGIREGLLLYGSVTAAEYDESTGKISALSEKGLKELTDYGAVILIEADGSKHMPVKMPEAWEPVIPDFTDLVIGVIGLDCLGKPLTQTAHRAEKLAEFLKKDLSEKLEVSDLVKLAAEEKGLRKGVCHRDYRVYFNKEDVLANLWEGKNLAEELREQGIEAFCGSLKEG